MIILRSLSATVFCDVGLSKYILYHLTLSERWKSQHMSTPGKITIIITTKKRENPNCEIVSWTSGLEKAYHCCCPQA